MRSVCGMDGAVLLLLLLVVGWVGLEGRVGGHESEGGMCVCVWIDECSREEGMTTEKEEKRRVMRMRRRRR